MKKENTSKIQMVLSGSDIEIPVADETHITDDKPDEKSNLNVEQLMDTILESEWVQKELGELANIPYYMLVADQSPVFLFNVHMKTYRTVPCPIEVIPIEPADEGNTYCMIGLGLYIVDDDMIKNIGWN